MSRLPRVALLLLLLLLSSLLPGCAGQTTWPSAMTAEDKIDARSHGYGSLHAFLADEANVDKILIVKSASDETEDLVRSIARFAATKRSELDALRDEEPPVSTDTEAPLPVVEHAARDGIAGQTARDLVFTGDTFEVRLLLSQAQALRYGRFLCEALAEREPNDVRSAWLTETAEGFESRYQEVIERLAPRTAE